MKKDSLEVLAQQMFDETDGVKLDRQIRRLVKNHLPSNRDRVLEIMMRYVEEGQIVHWRDFLVSEIADIISNGERKYAGFFRWTVTIPSLTYWGIDGLLKTEKRKAYDEIIKLIISKKTELSIRAKAIRSLSTISKQTFDRGLPNDPGYWKLDDLRIADVLAWQKNGYKTGKGYSTPKLHASLKNPKTEFQKVVAKLNSKLEKLRRDDEQDLANPSNWLTVADKKDIAAIEKRWALPKNYLQFIKYYSPVNVLIENRKYYQGLNIYGAQQLIERQIGYGINPKTKKALKGWPANLVVIGDHAGDPFCIDIDNIVNGDAPVYTSMHGQGKW